MSQQGVVIDQTITWCDTSIPANMIDAHKYTTMYAQAAARAVNPDPSSQQYFDAMTQNLQDIGWNVTDAGRESYNQQADKISPAAIVSSILNPYLSAAQQNQLAGLLDAIQQPDVSMKSFVDFWWRHASTTASKTNLAIGPLTQVENAPNISMVYYSFNFDASDKGSLFVEVDSASLEVSAFNLTMDYNFSMWPDKDLLKKVQAKEKDHIAETPLNL